MAQSPLPSMIPGQRLNGWYNIGPWAKKHFGGSPAHRRLTSLQLVAALRIVSLLWLQPQRTGFQDGGRRWRGYICPRPSSPSPALPLCEHNIKSTSYTEELWSAQPQPSDTVIQAATSVVPCEGHYILQAAAHAVQTQSLGLTCHQLKS